MKRAVLLSILVLVLAAAASAAATGTTPPGPWLPVIKDAIRTALKDPEYVTFRRVFFVNRRTDDGAVPVCGFVSFKQRKEEHAVWQSFFGLLTPPDAGKAGSFAAIRMGDEKAGEIATICRNYGVY